MKPARREAQRTADEFRVRATSYALSKGFIANVYSIKNDALVEMIAKDLGVTLVDGRMNRYRQLFSVLPPCQKQPRSPASWAKIRKKEAKRKYTVNFYESEEWRTVRYQALKLHGGSCQCCGARGGAGVVLHVDHIKPRSKFPELELELSNLQVLCEDCNLGKRAWDQTDWRPSVSLF